MEFFLISVVILVGAFTQSLTGFGLALISVPFLSLFLDAKMAIPIAGLFGWLVTFPVVWKMREHVLWKSTLLLVIASIPGTFLGIYLLKKLPSQMILIAMGIVLIITALHTLFGKKSIKRELNKGWTFLAGFCSGALGGGVGEPGPPVIAYTAMQPWSADQAKATLLSFFMLQMIGAIAGFYSSGLLTGDVLKRFTWGIPAFIMGIFAGLCAYQYLQRKQIPYHTIVHSLLLVIGCILIFKGFR
ncbi:UPF0721 transmembrane protein [Gammaproteobacteria bacterium]|nr:UPF0721 transmembrane protein [Gammaproteobacteria bacterium]